jgi:heme oxygenase
MSIEARSDSARSWLRHATAEIHEALHHLPAFEALLAGTLDLAGYRRMLLGLHAYHADAGAVCAAADSALGVAPPGAASDARLQRLDRDLRDLALAPPTATAQPAHRDPAWNIGFAYVVAGSAIGGQVLHRALEALLPGDAAGRSFFALLPAERAGWRRFCTLLDAQLAPADLPRAERGANAAFAGFRATMERLGADRG